MFFQIFSDDESSMWFNLSQETSVKDLIRESITFKKQNYLNLPSLTAVIDCEIK